MVAQYQDIISGHTDSLCKPAGPPLNMDRLILAINRGLLIRTAHYMPFIVIMLLTHACCFQTADKMVCIDANFGLVRKKAAGSSCCPPKLQGRHFLEQRAVDAFVTEKEKQTKDVDRLVSVNASVC